MIFAFTKKQLCQSCKQECNEFDGLTPDCSVCPYLKLPHTSKKKVLEIMARAICAIAENGEICHCSATPECEGWKNHMPQAELALIALVKITTGKSPRRKYTAYEELPILAPGFGGPAKIVEKKDEK